MPPRLPPGPFLYAVMDVEVLGPRALGPAVAAVARGGASLVQLRAKRVSDRSLLSLAWEALAAAHGAGALFVVNDRPDVARIIGADGVHVGQEDLSPRDARTVLGPDAFVGVSTHSVAQIEAAAREPVDYVAVGPVFPTGTKVKADPVVGIGLVRRARSLATLPIVAIGGMTRGNCREVIEAGADGAAVVSDLLAVPDLDAGARAFVRALRGTPGPA